MITAREARSKATEINQNKAKYIESVNTAIVTVANLGNFMVDVNVPIEYLPLVKGILEFNDYDATNLSNPDINTVTLRISW